MWKLAEDGSCNKRGCGLGIVLTSPEGDVFRQAIKYGFKVTNNKVEYEALIAGLALAKDLEVRKIEIQSDSQLIVNQL